MHNSSQYQVIKASGKKEKFDESKLARSLAATGIPVDTASQTINYLKKYVKPEVSTNEIFGHVSDYLKKANKKGYMNYNLKRAIMHLGPTGHPFERLVGDLLAKLGYDTQVDVTLGGECVTHEIDVIAVKKDETSFVECKYHNSPGTKSDVQVTLYTYARFLDIQKAMKEIYSGHKLYRPWVVTNTKLTKDAIDYASCMGMKATGWTYPKSNSLYEMIVSSGLHPVTVLDIRRDTLTHLLNRGIVTCARLKNAIDHRSVDDIITPAEASAALKDIKLICGKNE